MFHLAAEMLSALVLLYGAIFCKNPFKQQTALLFAQGMLAYTAINSAGYYAQHGPWLFLPLFGAVLLIAVINAHRLFKQRLKK
jgi:peptidoglycan/LPS O-acetylase OafA/YrhL